MATSTLAPRNAKRPARPARRAPMTPRHDNPSMSRVRLTPRGRVSAFTASVVALMFLVMATGQMADASGAASAEPVGATSVVVQAGDTLWGIAQEVAPGQDPRSVVGQIRELNDLGTRSIVPGQTLVLPTLG